tara:strand:- start:1601 stop:2824 length:1224 start_codon:yes stop_codon:yes gene_type:complete
MESNKNSIELKNKINNDLKDYFENFSKSSSKKNFRNLYEKRVIENKRKLKKNIQPIRFNNLINFFATDDEVNPKKIKPKIILVDNKNKLGDLFNLASTFWSVPPTSGYGRRLRYVIIDEYNGKLIGILGLKDTVIGLKVRDEWIGWEYERRLENISSIMEGYVVGAVPPYNNLLCGKLIVSLIKSKKIFDDFKEKYANKISEFSSEKIKNTNIQSMGRPTQGLSLVTISSALGKSSLYNRINLPQINLKLYRTGDKKGVKSGFTSGYGTFHISDDLYLEMVKYLKEIGHPEYARNLYGHGSNFKMRVIRTVFKLLEIDQEGLKHNIEREFFILPIAENFREYLCGKDDTLIDGSMPSKLISEKAIERWVIPRSERINSGEIEGQFDWSISDLLSYFSWYEKINLKLI